jgi:hypothetical protein
MAATDPADLAVTPEQVVERERPRRSRYGLIASAAAILTVLANVVQNAALANGPRVTPLDALRDAAGELGRQGLATERVLFIHDHTAGLLISVVLQAAAYAGIGLVLLELLRMTLDRGGRVPRPTRVLVLAGPALAAVGVLVRMIGLVTNAASFASSNDHSTQAAHDATSSGGLLVAGTIIGQLGIFGLAAALVLVALGAMRVGLLTRFVGVLGALVGVLQILGPVSSASFIVTAFWLAMVGALFLGRWPSGLPPAWEAGEARPWPSQQEVREQRERLRAERDRERERGRGSGGGTPAPAGSAPAPEATAAPSPATSARKKRKRRS